VLAGHFETTKRIKVSLPMPSGNLGSTSLKSKRRSTNPMQDYDRLPAELRAWVATAALPWRAGSVRKSFEKALARTGSAQDALAELDALQDRLIAKDAKAVWGAAR